MKKTWMLLGVGVVAAILALGAVACDDDDDDGNGDIAPTATLEPADGAAAPTEPGDGDGDGADGGSVTVTLNEEGGSGVTGTATLTDVDGSTEVVVTIDGGLEEGTHQNHIHTGTCAAQGPVEVPLTDLEAPADGSAAATTTTIDGQPLSSFTDGDNYIAVHALDGAVVACGDITA